MHKIFLYLSLAIALSSCGEEVESYKSVSGASLPPLNIFNIRASEQVEFQPGKQENIELTIETIEGKEVNGLSFDATLIAPPAKDGLYPKIAQIKLHALTSSSATSLAEGYLVENVSGMAGVLIECANDKCSTMRTKNANWSVITTAAIDLAEHQFTIVR